MTLLKSVVAFVVLAKCFGETSWLRIMPVGRLGLQSTPWGRFLALIAEDLYEICTLGVRHVAIGTVLR